MKKAAIFDLDGTLITTAGLHERAWTAMFRQYSVILTPAELAAQSGKKNITFIQGILDHRGLPNLDTQALSNEKDGIVIEMLKKTPPILFDGAADFLNLLKTNHISMGLGTSATKKTAEILSREIIHFFTTTIFAEDVGIGKPNPEIFLNVAAGLSQKPEDCIVFEDAESGVQAAKNGGFFCIAIDNGSRQNLSGADVVIKEYNPAELIKYFL